jgi:hypothetical protein
MNNMCYNENPTEGELSAYRTRTYTSAERHIWGQCNSLRQHDDHARDVQERFGQHFVVELRTIFQHGV